MCVHPVHVSSSCTYGKTSSLEDLVEVVKCVHFSQPRKSSLVQYTCFATVCIAILHALLALVFVYCIYMSAASELITSRRVRSCFERFSSS
jgi:hypothetical protein